MTTAVARIRDARTTERRALEDLQRRSASVSAEDRAVLEAHPDAVVVPAGAITERRLRVVVDGEDRVLGFSLVLPVTVGERELDGLFVEPDAMGRGLGRLLVADVVTRARADGARRLFVVSGPGARGFYEQLGFTLLDAVPTRLGPALQLQLTL
ncbi:MAG: family N-acetyltransferase [Solirubrobacterales bacterium]|nr:family N-acetyltransferase [Solirubrobacterales bacterium]